MKFSNFITAAFSRSTLMNAARIAFVFVCTFVLVHTSLSAQDTIAIGDPGTYVGEGNISMLEVGLTILVSYFTSLFPAAAKFKPYVRTAAVALLVTGAFVIFKLGALNEATLTLVLATFLPNFAYSGIVWEGLKFVLGLIGIKIKPATAAAAPPSN